MTTTPSFISYSVECLITAVQTVKLKPEERLTMAELLRSRDTIVSLLAVYEKSLIKFRLLMSWNFFYVRCGKCARILCQGNLDDFSFWPRTLYTSPFFMRYVSGGADAAGCFQVTWF